MGLLDGLFGNLDDPQKAAQFQFALGLLGGSGKTNKNFGADLANAGLLGAGAYGQAKNSQLLSQRAERENRSSDLAQLTQTYSILKDQDQRAQNAAMFSGEQYQPNPLLAQHEAKMAQLMNLPAMPHAGAAPSMPAPPEQASQYSLAVRPELRAQGPAPASNMDMRAKLAATNIPKEVAIGMINSGKAGDLYKMIGDAYVPKNGPAGITRLNPVTGLPEIVGGNAQSGQVPFVLDAQGNLVARPIRGAAEEVARAKGLESGATESAKAQYTPLTIPMPNGSTMVTTVGRFVGQQPQQAPQQQNPQQGVARLTVTDPSRGAGMSQTPGDRSQQEKLGEFFANTFVDTQKAEKAAIGGSQNLARMKQFLDGLDTSGLTPIGMKFANIAKGFGLDLDPTLPQKQAAEMLTNQMALELRNPAGGAGMPGAMSDSDREFLQGMSPGTGQTDAGRKLMFDTKEKLYQRDREVAQLARDYYKKNGKMDHGFYQALSDFANAHPLFPKDQKAEAVSANNLRAIEDEILRRRQNQGR
jgi:hypothetical protein